MNGNEVEIVVRSQDKSAAGLDSAKKRVKETGAEFGKLGESAGKGTADTEGHFKRMSSTVGVAMAGVGVAIATKAGEALTDFVGDSVRAASDLSESMNAVNVTFGKSAVVVQDWGERNAAAFGLSKREFNEYATPLGAMLKNAGLSMQDTTKWTIDLTKRASDMASVFNTDVGDALEAIQAGLRGESDPLEKYGVSLSAAAVEAQALADSHKRAASELTNSEKATARLELIMKQTSQTQGDFQNTSDGLANSQRRLKAEIENAKASIGEDLTPAMAKAAGAAAELVHALANIGDYLHGFPGAPTKMFENVNDHMGEIAKLDEKLSALVRAGAAREAARQMIELSDAAKEFGLTGADLGQLFPKYGQALADVARQTGKTSGAAQDLTKSLDEQRESLSKSENALLAQRDASRGLEAAYDDATDALRKNGKNLDIGTEKGRANQAALDEIASAAYKARDAIVEQGGSQAQANAVMATARSRFVNAATAMGMGAAEAKKLADKLFAIPKTTNANVNVNTGTANARLDALRAKLWAIQGLTMDMHAGEYGHGLGVYKATGGIVGQAATGGVRSNRVMTGEHGPEILDLPPGTRVHSNPDTMRMLGSSQPVQVQLEVVGGSGGDFERLLMEMIRRFVRVRGGDVQTALGR